MMREKSEKELWRPVADTAGKRERRSAGGIYSACELHDLLMFEKARADRTGMKLSLVLCNVARIQAKRDDVAPVIRELKRTVRSTDYLGWFSGTEIGILLPFTDRNGAEHVVENISLNGLSRTGRLPGPLLSRRMARPRQRVVRG